MTDSVDSDGLKEYINQLFTQYDTQNKGKLNFQQITKFFSDLLKSVGVDVTCNSQQIYEAIYMAKPGFNGEATREELYDIFRVMLNYAKKPIEPTPQQNYVNYQQYPQMQTQYINQNYNPYLQMQAQQQQPQYTAYNTMGNMGQTAYTYNGQNGQVWGYPSYMGMNSYGYRQ